MAKIERLSDQPASEPASELLRNVARIGVAGGAVFVECATCLAEEGLVLDLNGLQTAFKAPAEQELEALHFTQEFRPDLGLDPLMAVTDLGAASEDTLFSCTVNGLPDWALANRETLQIRILDRQRPVTIDVLAPIEVAPETRDIVFRAGVAAHRARGKLVLKTVDRSTGRVSTTSFPITNAWRGGNSPAGYAKLEHLLPSSAKGLTLTLSIEYEAFEEEEHDFDPFFFIADPHVGPKVPLNRDHGYIVMRGLAEDGPLVWLRADPPRTLEPNDTLSLVNKDHAVDILKGEHITVVLEEDQGHTLMMRASVPGDYAIFIDGAYAFNTHIGTDNTAVRLPNRYLTGVPRQFSVWHRNRLQILFRGAFLPPRILTPMEVLQAEARAPFPGPLMPQAEHRYEALKAHLAAHSEDSELGQLSHVLRMLEGGPDNVEPLPFRFPETPSPDVTVVIPAHNNFRHTYLALCSLILARNRATFEVILVDDASTDETSAIEDIVQGINVIHFATPQRFIRACNKAVEHAKAKYIALLNNDVEVTTGWLDALLDAFSRFPNVGLAGAKLLYPDGSLQDAGGIVWRNGNPWNYGNRQNPWEPRFCYARQVDYLSGAALMTTQAIWREVGGLSDYLEPMYFEDTDFAFKVRQAGYSTWFVPDAVIYHHEGATSGTDASKGLKRNQELNRPKFKRRWNNAFSAFGREGESPDLEKDRNILGRVLFIDHETPRPDKDAGSYAAQQEIRLVQSLGYKVSFLPHNMAHVGSYTNDLQKMGVEVIYAPFFLSAREYLETNGVQFDAFYITRYNVAINLLEPIRRAAPHGKIIFNTADLHFLRELRTGVALNDPDRIESSEQIRDAEFHVMNNADVILSYNDSEHALVEVATQGQVPVLKCPWVVGLPADTATPEMRQGLSFVGNFRHHPNAEGLRWFVRDVFPLCLTADPGLSLWIYGANITNEIRSLESDSIHPIGFVEDIADAFVKHRAFVAPLLSGAGLKGKVLSAMSHGIPCILSPVAAEGVGLRHGIDCFICRKPEDWLVAIEALRDDATWRKLSTNAQDYVSTAFSFERGRELMRTAFEAADLYTGES